MRVPCNGQSVEATGGRGRWMHENRVCEPCASPRTKSTRGDYNLLMTRAPILFALVSTTWLFACSATPAGSGSSSGDPSGTGDSLDSATSGDDGPPQEGMACTPGLSECPAGFKCTPKISTPAGTVVDSARCVEVTGNAGADQACERDRDTGIDDCQAGSFCLVDFEDRTGTGVCRPFCDPGQVDDCRDGSVCISHIDGWLPLCMNQCHPFLGACPLGQLCETYTPELLADGVVCAVTGPEFALDGEPCNPPLTWCADGLHCTPAAQVPNCPEGSPGCCSPWCDAMGALDQCPSGQRCECVYEAKPSDFCRMGSCVIKQ